MALVKKQIKRWHQAIVFGAKRLALPVGIGACDGILLTGSPRSGTTWLGSLFRRLPRMAVVFEPLHCLEVPAAAQAGFKMRTFKSKDDSWPEGAEYLDRCLSGKGLNRWELIDVSIKEAAKARGVVLKCVRANRLLPWFCKQLHPVRPPLLVVRHPCAVIASQLRQGSWKNPRTLLPEEIPDGYEYLRPLIGMQSTIEEILAVRWAVDNAIPMWDDGPQPWMTIFYEDLQRHFEQALTEVLGSWGIDEIPLAMLQERGRPSRLATAGSVRGISGWKQDLSSDKVRRIMTICEAARLRFYAQDGNLCHEFLPPGVKPVGHAFSSGFVSK